MAPTTPKLRLLRNRPLCIMCARDTEAEEIAKALGIADNRISGHEVQKVKDGYTFYLGSFRLLSGEELQYYVTSGLRQGIQSFTIHASILFSILRPRFVIHAGVCAGYHDLTGNVKMSITDVIFGEAAINYEEGKMENVAGQLLFRPDYNRVACNAGDLKAFAEASSRPNYHYGEFISGASVRTDADVIFTKIRREVNRNAIALDMEASAFIQLCEHFEGDQVISLGVIKGISDFGDSFKGTVENAYTHALENTAKGVKEWVVHRIRAITWAIKEDDEPGARLVPGYYENFIRRVLDNYLSGWPVTDKLDSNIVIPRNEIKGLKTVLPKSYSPSFVQELGHVQALVQRFRIPEVNVGGDAAGRYLHYKGGYFMDWSRTVNSLKICEDGEYQVQVFGRVLSKCDYYSGSDESPAVASVVTWEDTVQWLKELEKSEEDERKEKAAQAAKLEKKEEEEPLIEKTAEQNMREGRQLERDKPLPSTVLGEGRQESPAPIEDPAASTDGGCGFPHTHSAAHNGAATKERHKSAPSEPVKSAGRHFTWTTKRSRSKEPNAEQRNAALPSKRPQSNEPKGKGRSATLSPRRSITRLLHSFRKPSSAHEQDGVIPPMPGK